MKKMADIQTDLITERRQRAVEELDQLFESQLGAKRMAPDELSEYIGQNFDIGWCLSRVFSDDVELTIRVLLAADFPYSAPRIAISGGPKALDWPHLEPEGLLCLNPPDAAVDIDNPTDVVQDLLRDSIQLIEDSIYNENKDDFRDEFLSYWRQEVAEASLGFGPIISILEPREPCRRISVWISDNCITVAGALVVGENNTSIARWMSNRDLDVKSGQFVRGFLIWTHKPLVPTEFPKTGKDLLFLIQSLESKDQEVLVKSLDCFPRTALILIGSRSRFGTCFAAILIDLSRDKNCLLKGFRPGKVPLGTLLSCTLVSSKLVAKAEVDRADHGWIHGRDQDRSQEMLRQNRVAIIGCGSVGGQVARNLAQAGVGDLLLIDHDTLSWTNTSRHCLGARSVYEDKATALAHEIKSSLPHIGAVSARVERVGLGSTELMNELATYDLLISTSGNWAVESFLNDWQSMTAPAPPILYGWVEEHALAAHAVRIDSRGPCFRCGVNGNGVPHLRVIDWTGTDVRSQEPRCGASYSPYGPCELAFAHALISQAVIDSLVRPPSGAMHRLWIADPARIREAGGQIADKVVKQFEALSLRGGILEAEWHREAACPVCVVRTR